MERLSSFADLLELQQIDANVDKLLQDRRSLPELADHALARREAREAAHAAEEATVRMQSLDRDLSRTEDELQMAEQKLREQERRLFAGRMNARETENMRAEVESLRRQVASMEDELLEFLDMREGMQEEERMLAGRADATAEVEQRLAARIAESRGVIDASLSRFRERRDGIVAEVEPRLLQLYTRLRERRGGIVVGETSGRVCGACHLQMPIAEYEEVVRDAIPQCINCAAILVL
jgi:hypothetical protein